MRFRAPGSAKQKDFAPLRPPVSIICQKKEILSSQNKRGDRMKDKNFIEQEKEDFNQGAENEFYDYIQMGPLEEEILYEFHFDVEQFRRYLQKQKQKK